MKSHIRRGRAGLTMVELLVTIIIAAIAFAALVPFFVQAQKAGSGDTVRNEALNLAQDKIERIRELDYAQITKDNLEDRDFSNGQFGTTWPRDAVSGERTFTIKYTVANVPAGAADGDEQYKKVIVDVVWNGPPTPVKHAVLQTYVYKQFAGPYTESLTVVDPVPNDALGIIVLDPSDPTPTITLRAQVSLASVERTKRVNFSVLANNGSELASGKVDSTGGQTFDWTWDASGASEGIYTFTAVGVGWDGNLGRTYTIPYRVDLGAPPAPTWRQAVVGDGAITLRWDEAPVGDLSHYRLYRSLTAGFTPDDATLYADGLLANTYPDPDSALVNGTLYYYRLIAVDLLGNESPPSAQLAVEPMAPSDGDDLAPTTPSFLTATRGGRSVRLTWTESVDQAPLGVTPAGLLRYEVWRSVNGAPFALLGAVPPAPTPVIYDDSLTEWGWTVTYQVRAVDGNLNASPFASSVPVVIPDLVPKLTVRNTANQTFDVRLVRVSDGKYFNQSGAEVLSTWSTQINANASKVWSTLRPELYRVEYKRTNKTWADKRLMPADLVNGDLTVDIS
jgi:type II secretory pathway pseudopilin PulG